MESKKLVGFLDLGRQEGNPGPWIQRWTDVSEELLQMEHDLLKLETHLN